MPAARSLSSSLRKKLESAVLAARRASENASRAAIDGLGVFADRRPNHLDADQAALRNGLRAKWRQFGADCDLLMAECAYEQWHRLLFARFLAENNLLLHPQYRTPVTLADCEELATDLGEPDGWSVAARFAAEILPGIFRLDDPCVLLRLAPEGRHALEQAIDRLPAEIFAADDALGWVYQFWQKNEKDEINASERKIGGADLAPVTQLFTENYMVRFLLENSLGAWWASRHPDSPLVAGFEYLRLDATDEPAAGTFDGWPDRVAEVTVMDPCCGSGHFLVEAFSMLWRMRAEEDGLSPVEAQDAVLRDNLHGLELDPRCVQIAMFAIALQAWKAGAYRPLPVPNIACSGIPAAGSLQDWRMLARGDERLVSALTRLHTLFKDANTLGSLINPVRVVRQGNLYNVGYTDVAPLLDEARSREAGDPAAAALGHVAVGVVRASSLLSRQYTLIVTNVPYLARRKHNSILVKFADSTFPDTRAELAYMCSTRFLEGVTRGGTVGLVLPQKWRFQSTFRTWRARVLDEFTINFVANLGTRAFRTPMWDLNVDLVALTRQRPTSAHLLASVDVSQMGDAEMKAERLTSCPVTTTFQKDQRGNPEERITLTAARRGSRLEEFAQAYQGIATGDDLRWRRLFWELPTLPDGWRFFQSSVSTTKRFSGCQSIVWLRPIMAPGYKSSAIRGREAWGGRGITVSQTGQLNVALYTGEPYDQNAAVILPSNPELLAAVWEYCSSPDYQREVRLIESTLKVTNATLVKVPFDVDRWRAAAEAAGALPEPWSDDPTQWLFEGRPEVATAPLQVAVGRLVGYGWPGRAESDDLGVCADADGIVCLPSVAGEASAADRVQQVLARAFGDIWSPSRMKELLRLAGSKKNITDWLRDEFFKQHCGLFGNRPFVWHVWDGQRDGFSALMNYHRLDRKMLDKLTYTYLGQDWMERQRAEVRDEVLGAEGRLAAALELQRRLEAILDGEKPYDIYVRWKELHEQPVGWEPDLNDGVRLNIRPFVEAGVLRAPFNIHWKKDRGKNPDGTERHNDVHLSLAEKLDARKRAGRT